VATLTKVPITNLGIAPPTAVAAAGGGDNFTPDDRTFLIVKNAGGSPVTVTVVTPKTDPGGHAIADDVVSVPATTGERWIGPFPAEYYADPANTVPGNCGVTYSGVTSVTVAVVSLPRSG